MASSSGKKSEEKIVVEDRECHPEQEEEAAAAVNSFSIASIMRGHQIDRQGCRRHVVNQMFLLF
jgi:hypothetical protein